MLKSLKAAITLTLMSPIFLCAHSNAQTIDKILLDSQNDWGNNARYPASVPVGATHVWENVPGVDFCTRIISYLITPKTHFIVCNSSLSRLEIILEENGKNKRGVEIPARKVRFLKAAESLSVSVATGTGESANIETVFVEGGQGYSIAARNNKWVLLQSSGDNTR